MAQQNIIGSAVRRIRVENDLTQDAFAARCQLAGWDLSRETLSKIEASLRRVNDAEVMMLAKILGCKITDLFPANTKSVLPVLRHSK
ncbi:helix-turn-helix transcriptional regulator [Prosthecobacter sp.]|jgi:transcriptional regulator with XRE-family HTH domain|uniref:helix-turn-helix transcriptional regulator n=1 Tax=Prosthecobacter sp. TaxID=1965333 RepID=UPI0037C8B914